MTDQRFSGLLNSIKYQREWGRVPTDAQKFLDEKQIVHPSMLECAIRHDLMNLFFGFKSHGCANLQSFRHRVAYIYEQKSCFALFDMGKRKETQNIDDTFARKAYLGST